MLRRSFLSLAAATALGFGLALAPATGPVQAHDYKVGTLKIDHPWTRATPAGARVAGGYMTITNSGAADRLVSGTATIAGRVEVHEMAVNNGVMTMRELAGGLPIPEKGSVELKPGSYHVMFMDLKQPLKMGESFKGTLTFEKAGTIEVEFAVEAMGSQGMDHGAHGHGGHQHGATPPKP
jgi:hypothetical protein